MTWKFEPAEVASTEYGRSFNCVGWAISPCAADENTINRAVAFVDALFALLEQYDVEVFEDFHADRVIMDLNNGFAIEYASGKENSVYITHHRGDLVGKLIRENSEAAE